ncbi:M1 family metallopeptidase [Trujillonella endophytica]|uniref:Aminopeptidase N n=1 Tax=Trujillonella endophytica TaxID=673521 RepID=A0A1H8SE01_9ACTN|nr:M1 family metallopeptidase [Trujillella endophytica]SEO76960.1 Peptidase family M1 [Trujillella endophytica]
MTRGRRARSWAAALTGLALLGGCTTEVAGSAAPAGSPGADGFGDPYFPLDGNGGYDVDSYALDLRFDPGSDELSGTATIVATATQSLSAFNLDLFGFEVSSVTVDGEDAGVGRDGGELTVTPAADLRQGAQFTTVVAYEGVPEPLDDGLGVAGFVQTDDGAVAAGQPDVAASWFPVNDHPADAASVDVSITVPEGLEGISNGELVDSTTDDGWTTWQWSAAEPMAPYLVTLAVGEFEIEEYEQDGIRYWDAIDPALAEYGASGSATVFDLAQESLALAPDVVAVLEEWFGPYPFAVAGGIVDDVPEMQFALENQTRPVYSPVFFTDADDGEIVVVHELAHQWAGDSVRLAGWQHIWLNEGFATYAEWLWADAQGTSTPQEFFDDLAAVPADRSFWRVAIGDPGPESDALFSEAVYLRGAMTVHALRTELGEDAFAELVLEWFGSEGGRAVTTDDFVALAEEISGADLDDFFAQWLGAGKPPSLE